MKDQYVSPNEINAMTEAQKAVFDLIDMNTDLYEREALDLTHAIIASLHGHERARNLAITPDFLREASVAFREYMLANANPSTNWASYYAEFVINRLYPKAEENNGKRDAPIIEDTAQS